MIKKYIKDFFTSIGYDYKKISKRLNGWYDRLSKRSLKLAMAENRYGELVDKLRLLVPDISDQEESDKLNFNDYFELKRRLLQSFQCRLMLKALENMPLRKLMVVDIGDSAGTHMFYLKNLLGDKYEIDAIGVNLDPRAIKKIEAKGVKAVLCRAEDLRLDDKIDLFTSFEMVEHLHNPAIFFRNMAKKTKCDRFVITVPYVKNSRVALYHTRFPDNKKVHAEEEHIFELSPKDWKLLILHSGWRVAYEEIYYQYPRRIPLISRLLANFWKMRDFEGFWGAILEKDTSISDLYMDWEE